MTDDIDLDQFDPPERPDFRRVGKGTPFVMAVDGGKRQRYGRSSNAGKILDDESNLTDWKLRTVVFGASQRPELMAAASVLDLDANKKELRDIAEKCLVAGKGERRSVIGTAVHAMFDHLDRDDGWSAPPNFLELCAAYTDAKMVWGLEPVEIEVHCINDEYRLAGTLDRRYRVTRTLVAPDGTVIPIGSLIVADIKTGKELEYAAGSYATQLAAYVDSQRYDVTKDERSPFVPESVKEWGLILHADSAGTRVDVYWVDIDAGRMGLDLATKVKEWRRKDGLLTIGRRLKMVVETQPNEGDQGQGDDDTSSPPLAPVGLPEPRRTASRATHLAGRVRAVVGASQEAAKELQRNWPTGVPGLKQEGHTWDQLDAIEAAVVKVETNHSLPFYPMWDDPLKEPPANSTTNQFTKPATSSLANQVIDKENLRNELMNHPRSGLIRRWINEALAGGMNLGKHNADSTELANALYEFARQDETAWPDDDLTLMLDGSLRALGYVEGLKDLGRFKAEHSAWLMSAAFAITAGNAYLLFDEDGKAIVRTNVRT